MAAGLIEMLLDAGLWPPASGTRELPIPYSVNRQELARPVGVRVRPVDVKPAEVHAWCAQAYVAACDSFAERSVERPNKGRQGQAERSAYFAQLEDIEAPLSSLVLADERLGPTQSAREIFLAKAGRQSSLA